MKVVILEDEVPAAERLEKMLLEISADIKIIKTLNSYKESIAWLQSNPSPDLILMDIELGDGLSLELVKKVKINCPIIFITAYDEYWQEAFELNGIDYLLKPLRKERLQAALNKLNELKEYFRSRLQDLLAHQDPARKHKDRFLIKRGSKFVSIKTEDIAYFYASHKLTFLVDKEGSKFILDQSLSEVKKAVNPDTFFRINRKYLVNLSAIKNITALPKSKMVLEISPAVSEELIISSENSAEFKKWLDR